MNISGPFVKRPVGTALLAAGILVAGVICYFLLGVASLPNLEFPAIFVQASVPGADARNMANTVAAPLERHLGQISGINQMNSSSSEGSSFVVMLFNVGVNINDKARDAQAAINAAAPDLPSSLRNPPIYHKANPNNSPVLILALTSTTQPLSQLYSFADSTLSPRIAQITGVAQVSVAGGATPAVRVDLNLRAMSAMGLTGDQVRNALVAANVIEPMGYLSDGHTQMAIRANTTLATPAQFADTVIAMNNGVPVRLGDIAHVYRGQQDQYQAAWYNGKRSILLLIRKQADANVIAIVDKVRALLPELRVDLPQGVKLTPFFDRTPTIRASVNEVQITLLISLGLVVMIMLLFLRRWAPTLIAALAAPLSIAGAFIVMYVLGYTLDNFSLMALVIAIGFVVDDAIVVIENIHRHLEKGLRPMQAALTGSREVGFTVVSITASLVAVFSPLLFMSGLFGMLFREFSVTLVAAIVISALVSLTLTPSLCGQFLRSEREAAEPSRLGRKLEAFHRGLLARYSTALDWALHHPRTMAAQVPLLLAITIALMMVIPKGFFPQQDTGALRGYTEASPTTSPAAMMKLQQRVATIVQRDPAVESVGSQLGSWRSGSGSTGTLLINLKPLGKGRSKSTDAVMNRLRRETSRVPGIAVYLSPVQTIGGRGNNSKTSYSYKLKGNNYSELEEWVPRLAAAMSKSPLFRDVSSSIEGSGLRETLNINRSAAARLGVSVAAIDGSLYDAFGQRQISTIYSGLNQFQVVLNALPSMSESPESIKSLYVPSNSGGMVPITAVARLQPGLSPTEVDHEGQFPVVSVTFNLAPGVPMSRAYATINRMMRDLRLPGDIQSGFGSNFRHFVQQQNNTPLLILGALLAVYIVLGILYENLIHPITILSTLPAAGVGAMLALLITNSELSVVSIIAIVLLIGIVKKNAILMVDFALVAERDRGLSPAAAIREACLIRFRPIMMTTMVAMFSALPLAIGFGAGAALRRPLGIALIGGLLFSQALTLLSTPAIYLLFGRWSQRRRERRRTAHSVNTASG
ncbi:MAG: efflux RND transporter permease subunit [Gammaproteobacteria bacterium]